jgi:hypothetical protein
MAFLPQNLILLSKLNHHLSFTARLFFFGLIVVYCSCVLSEFIDDISHYFYQFSLYGVIHLKNKRNVVVSIITFDGYPQQQLPNLTNILINVQIKQVLRDISADLFLKILSNLLQYLCV